MTDASLKCVVAWSSRRWLCDTVEDALKSLAGPDEVRRLGDETCLLYTDLAAADVRDRLRSRLEPGDSLLVVEFEKWSGYGAGIGSPWLLRHGH